jgi:glutaredoxin
MLPMTGGGDGTAGGGNDPRVVLVGRQGCHLCDEARDVVRRVAQETGSTWTEVDVDADARLLAAYSDQVPVVLVDGRQHDFWRVDERRLRAALTARAG